VIVEYRWKSDQCCSVHPGQHCLFMWVPALEQVELDIGDHRLYLDKVFSVSGLDEDEEKLVLDQSLPQQLSFFMEVA